MDLKSIDVQGWLDWFAKNKDAFEAIDVILGIFVILLIALIIVVIKRFLKWMRPHTSMLKEDASEATKTDNSQTQNFANQIGSPEPIFLVKYVHEQEFRWRINQESQPKGNIYRTTD